MQYKELCEIYEKLEGTTKRLEKTEILAEFLRKMRHEKNKEFIYLIQGRVFPDYDERETGISSQLVIKALVKATGRNKDEVVKEWKKIGDLGKVAENLTGKKRQSTLYLHHLTAEKVYDNIRKLVEFTGKGTVDKKMGLISELLTSATSVEAKYIVRTLMEDLRIGVASGIIRDAIVWCFFGKDAGKEIFDEVQEAYDKTADFAEVFEKAKKGKKSLAKTELHPGKPVKVMLFLKVKTPAEAFEKVGKPAAIEYKYDGFRMLINKDDNGEIRIFTRRLDNVTSQFPEIKDYVKKNVKGKSFILDSEAVGYDPKTHEYKTFQAISQRIKRKYHIEELQKKLPVEINVFDILYYNGKSLLKEKFKERRKIIEKIVNERKREIVLAKQIITDDEKKVQEFYREAIKAGEEGIMIKSLDAPYKPGARVGYGVKLKETEREFDLVIVKAEYGTGKRAGWLTSYTVACRDEGKLKEIGKVSTGLKEKDEQGESFHNITKLLKPLIEKEHGKTVEVKPKIVVTVTYQNIQKSPTYDSGFALRFPRFTALRHDKDKSDIATLSEIEKEYKKMFEGRSYG